MTHDFDTPVDRRASGSVKWGRYPAGVLPMWVADMDFAAPPAISDALKRRLEHPVYGYEWPSARLSEVVVAWLDKRYGWKIKPEDIVFLPGLVSGTNLVMRAFGHLGDEAIVMTPSYPPFLGAPGNNGMALKTIKLAQTTVHGVDRYDIDFDAFGHAFTPRTAVYIHCHPHNPTGREYSTDEMKRLARMCLDRNVLICSDEIHCDLMLDGRKHVPMACVSPEISQNCVTLMAPSKTFNIPGLGCAFAIVQNPRLRQRLTNAETGIVPHVNALGLAACEAAFTECDAWLADLQAYLAANRDAMLEFIARRMPHVGVAVPEATYLAFLDFSRTHITGSPYTFFLERAKVALNDGATFGPGYATYSRLNFGCPRGQLMDALERMATVLDHTHE
ncbi:MAG: PatB family C-S lyase, partial [Thermoflexales bacterium]